MKNVSPITLVLYFTLMFGGFNNLFSTQYENPNGEPFLISVGIEKNIDSFKFYNQSSFYITAPINRLITFKYRENVTYSEKMVILKSEHDKIQFLDKYYSLEFHLPLFALFK